MSHVFVYMCVRTCVHVCVCQVYVWWILCPDILQVYTIDVTDPSALRKAVMDVLKKGDLQPFIPYELTAEVVCIHPDWA